MVSGPLQLRLAARRKEITNRALHPNYLAAINVFVVIEPEPVFIASAAQHFSSTNLAGDQIVRKATISI